MRFIGLSDNASISSTHGALPDGLPVQESLRARIAGLVPTPALLELTPTPTLALLALASISTPTTPTPTPTPTPTLLALAPTPTTPTPTLILLALAPTQTPLTDPNGKNSQDNILSAMKPAWPTLAKEHLAAAGADASTYTSTSTCRILNITELSFEYQHS
jgi:hypothetical protein